MLILKIDFCFFMVRANIDGDCLYAVVLLVSLPPCLSQATAVETNTTLHKHGAWKHFPQFTLCKVGSFI